MFILANMWFQTLMRQFFFNVDKIVFGFISTIYDFLITIARTSVITQADIADMAGRVYKLLAIFMIFKVTFSLIMYVVNPDDFSDKDKGVSKLGTNIVISLALLILTPYIFSYAYQLQTIILEDNSLAALIFGEKQQNVTESPFESAGDKMAYITMMPFFMPNPAIDELYECSQVTKQDGSGAIVFNSDCSGLNSNFESNNDDKSLFALTKDGDGNENTRFTQQTLKNYVAGVQLGNLDLMFRQDMAIATNPDNTEYIMNYKYIFSTVTGVLVVLLLLTFCLDVALRSVKLAFLQLVAPIPIISFVDPKSSKEGMFKNWVDMCFKTYLSLFVRLLALYFAVYIISRIDKMVDIINGSYVSNLLVKIFIIIGALMFAKQFPEILKGLGLPLDGGGFTLNPLKKIEDSMLGGKMVSNGAKAIGKRAGGLARGVGAGVLAGGASAITGHGFRGFGTAIKDGWKGEKFGKTFSNSYSAAKNRDKELDMMKMDGVDPGMLRREKGRNFFRGATREEEKKNFDASLDTIKKGYEQYYKGVLGGDKVAKMLEQRRIAAENAGRYEEATRLQDAIDARVADVSKNNGTISLSANRAELEKFGAAIESGTATYANDFSTASTTMGLSADVDKGLNSIETAIGKAIEHIDTNYNGRFDYQATELGTYTQNPDGTYSVSDLKVTNGKAKAVTRAAENSSEAKEIEAVYRYLNSNSGK